MNFGTYSLWSIVVNTLVLWIIPIVMILGAVAALGLFIFDPFGSFFLYLALPFLIYFETLVRFFSNLEGGINAESFPWQFSVAYYSFLASFLIFKLKKHNE